MEQNGATMQSNADSDSLVSHGVSAMMATMYLGATAPTEPLANPLYADLAGLPPVFACAGDAETLQDNAERFAERAREAGVDVELEIAPGQQHVYVFMAGKAKESDSTIGHAADWLRPKLGL
jgi:acetyl esterase/lipase